MNYLFIFFKIIKIDIEFMLFYKKLIRLIYKCHKFMRRMRYMLTAVNILKYIIIKFNHIIKTYYYVLLGNNIIYIFLIILFFFNDLYVQTFLGLFIGFDIFLKHLKSKKIQKCILTPSLNIYYPISFSIFSVTIRITGTFLTLLLGLCYYIFF